MNLLIEKLVYGGDGLARLQPGSVSDSAADSRRKAVFIPFVLAGELVDATVSEDRGGFARAHLNSVLEPSLLRTDPPCPYFTRCGGCQYQHTSYPHQLAIKAAILHETLARIAKLELACDLQVHSAEPLHYRNRTRLQLHAQPFALGYFRAGSNELLPVESCPISSPLIERAMQAVWQIGRTAAASLGSGEIEFFANSTDDALLVELHSSVFAPWKPQQARTFAEALHARISELTGLVLFPPAKPDLRGRREPKRETPKNKSAVRSSITQRGKVAPAASSATATETDAEQESSAQLIWGTGSLEYRAAGRAYRVSAGSFFQSNRHLIDQLVTTVTAGDPGAMALDLYAGVGLFAVALAERFERVVAVETSAESYADLQSNVPPHVKTTRLATEAFLRQAKRRPEVVVVDPPRAGLGNAVAQLIADMEAPLVTYVSCDPATLARDLVVLTAAGYAVEQAHLFDLFPQTGHLETVLHLTRT